MASVWDKNNNRPKGRPVKVPREKVVELIQKGLTNYEVSQEVGLCLSRVRTIRAQERKNDAKQSNPEFVFGRITENESDTQARIRAYCLSVGIDNRCVVRQATEDERREYNIIG